MRIANAKEWFLCYLVTLCEDGEVFMLVESGKCMTQELRWAT